MGGSMQSLSIVPEIVRYRSEVNKYPFLSPEEERTLFIQYKKEDDVGAAHKIVLSHLRLVVKLAYEMKSYGIALMDLVSEGTMGLMHAVRKFDITVGSKFSSYAMLWIKAYMQEYVIKSWSLVRLGTTAAQKKLFYNLKRTQRKILGHNNSSLSSEETKQVAQKLSVLPQEVREMELRLGGDISLDEQVSSGVEDSTDNRTRLDHLADIRSNQEVVTSNNQHNHKLKSLLLESLSQVSEREQDIIRCRHFKDKPDTLSVLAKRYHVSNERIRQIELMALNKITEACRVKQRALSL